MENIHVKNNGTYVMDTLLNLHEISMINCGGIDLIMNNSKHLRYFNVMNTFFTDLQTVFTHIPESLWSIKVEGVDSLNESQIIVNRSDVSQLRDIVLKRSKVQKLLICGLEYLVSLDLSLNELNESSSYICQLSVLKTLDLSHNKFNTLTESNVDACEKINQINLSYNHISYLNANVFSGFNHLINLNLTGNRLFKLQLIFNSVLIMIQVDLNPWDCLWLYQIAEREPEYFVRFKYTVKHDRLAVRGLPCNVKQISTEMAPTSTISYHPSGLIQPYPTRTITEPYYIPSKWKILFATVGTGVLMSHVIFMIYNNYKRHHFIPFYRRLPKERRLFNIRETITTRTDSFFYEQPIRHFEASTLHTNIYEEIPDRITNEPPYDRLQFHRFDMEDEEDVIDV
ncbi:uncharacterized protein LOC135700457 [Ochlerotatus camptorhynchus]|uniref:uncharacterized protein LOC135700457 n=1 Tax=Ochlerotatus camptorhynchus TaxID=644619 RepID=UPI0031D88E25